MPELPEIANFKKYADATALHKKIEKVVFGDSKPLQESKKTIRESLIGQTFIETQQLGKYLFLKSDGGKSLVLHFGMSGSLYFSGNENLPKYTILSLWFEDDTQFSFVCPRKFGRVWITESLEHFRKEHSLGPDALAISKPQFLALLDQKKIGIKSLLMDQHIIAGIGNVYTDEILFQSQVHPKTLVSKLDESELSKIYSNISKVLKKAIIIIGKEDDSPNTWLKAHRKEGAPCPKCKGEVKKIQVGGRSTYFCPNCQKEKE